MKAAIIALFVFAATIFVVLIAIGSPDFQGLKPWPSNPDRSMNSIEAKLSEALQDVSAMQKSNLHINKIAKNSSATNSSAINSTGLNDTQLNSTINSTAINNSAKGATAFNSNDQAGTVSLLGSSSVSPQEVGSSSKANFNGFWGMEAKQEGIGKSGINSRTLLSGGFEVDKTVQFQDRGY